MSLSRREFLIATAGLAAQLLPTPSWGEAPNIRGPYAVVGTVISGDGSPPQTNHAVLINKGHIEAIVRPNTISDRPLLNYAGCTIMPGVINCHAHRIYDAHERRERYLRHGVTSIGDPGSPIAAIPLLLDNPKGATTTAACSGPMLCPPGGYPLTVHSSKHGLVVTSPEHGRERVRQLADMGVSMIKIALEPGPYPEPWPMFDRTTSAAICDEARRRAIIIRCHLEDLRGLETALDAGIHTVEHVPHRWRIDGYPTPVLKETDEGKTPIRYYRELLDRMVREEIIMTPTLDVLSRSIWHGPELYEPVRYFARAGGRIAVGNDHPYRRTDAGMPEREFTLLATAGLDTSAIIKAATQTSASACGFSNTGTITPGAIADLLVIPGNPLEDLTALSEPRHIIKDGIFVD